MSNKDYAKSIIDKMPEDKVIFIINILENCNNIIEKSDDYDLRMVRDAEIDNDEEYTAEEVNRILGLDI